MLKASSTPLGRRIRDLRRQQRRRLQDIADACGFSKSLLSKIEHGRTVPPVATLARIAKALGVPVAALLDDHGDGRTAFESAAALARRPATRTDKGYLFHALAAERGGKAMQPFIFTAVRGQVQRRPLTHDGEEFVYMLAGEMRYRVGDTEYRLRPGDSLYFASHHEHDLEPVTATVRYLAVFADPAALAPPAAAKAAASAKPRRSRP